MGKDGEPVNNLNKDHGNTHVVKNQSDPGSGEVAVSTLWSPGLSLPVTSDRTASISSNHPLVNTGCVKHLRALDHISDNIQFLIEKFENLFEFENGG